MKGNVNLTLSVRQVKVRRSGVPKEGMERLEYRTRGEDPLDETGGTTKTLCRSYEVEIHKHKREEGRILGERGPE